jgi:putative tricarboxylic transport membrane protein
LATSTQHAKRSSPPTTRWNDETVAGLTVLLLSLVAFALTYRFDSVPDILAQNIPPTFFPRLMLLAAGSMSAMLLVQGLRQPARRKPGIPPIVFVTGAFVAASVLSIDTLGIVGLTCLTSVVLPVLWGERRPIHILLFAVVTSATIYLVFGRLLRLQLPMGFLEPFL